MAFNKDSEKNAKAGSREDGFDKEDLYFDDEFYEEIRKVDQEVSWHLKRPKSPLLSAEQEGDKSTPQPQFAIERGARKSASQPQFAVEQRKKDSNSQPQFAVEQEEQEPNSQPQFAVKR